MLDDPLLDPLVQIVDVETEDIDLGAEILPRRHFALVRRFHRGGRTKNKTAIASTQGLADTEKTEMENVLEGAPELALILLATSTVMDNVRAVFTHLDHNKFFNFNLFICFVQSNYKLIN